MKTPIHLFVLTLISTSAFAKIVSQEGKFYVESKGNRTPIALLNSFISSNEVSTVKLFDGGQVNIVAFAKKGGKEKIYSVAEEGYLYGIKPFTDYRVKKSTGGRVTFQEFPGRTYRVDPKGYFFY